MSKKHYIAMSGIVGCLPDCCESFNRLNDAVEFLGDLWNDFRGVKSSLRKDRIWYKPAIDSWAGSLDYCEIVECDCDNPEIHNDY